MIATDGVFSMDGYVAPLDAIVELAERYNALVMVDDSHAVGFVGPNGAGTPELFGVQDRVDIVTGTLGKALGGASGGYTAAHTEIVEMLRQRSRPYLFSNSIPPSIAAAGIATLDMLASSVDLLSALRDNTAYFRAEITAPGFDDSGVRSSDRSRHDRRRGRGRRHWPTGCWPRGSTSGRSRSRWCPAARLGSGPRCRRPIPGPISTGRSTPSSGRRS